MRLAINTTSILALMMLTGCASIINPGDKKFILISSDKIFALAVDDVDKLKQQGMTQAQLVKGDSTSTEQAQGQPGKMQAMSLEVVAKPKKGKKTEESVGKAPAAKLVAAPSVAEKTKSVPATATAEPSQLKRQMPSVTLPDDIIYGDVSLDPARQENQILSMLPQYSQGPPPAIFGNRVVDEKDIAGLLEKLQEYENGIKQIRARLEPRQL